MAGSVLLLANFDLRVLMAWLVFWVSLYIMIIVLSLLNP